MGPLIILTMTVLPASSIAYLIGLIFIRKLKLSKSALFGGFFVTWLITTFLALAFADRPTANEAGKAAIPAAFIASVIGIGGIAWAGKRKI